MVIRLVLDSVHLLRGEWSLRAHGLFLPGIHLISGAVGSGKSTLGAFLAGTYASAEGVIVRDAIASAMISFQFPEYQITSGTLAEECSSWGLDPLEILSRTRLDDKADSDPLKLSRGELKRLHLSCVLALPSDLLILDEPFSSLDCAEKEQTCAAISRRKTGITIILTHEQTTFPAIDYLWEISGGELISHGPPPGALESWSGAPPLIRRLIEDGRTPENISQKDLMEAACRT